MNQRYELLNEGDLIKEGDELLDWNERRFMKTTCPGAQVTKGATYFRPLPDKPKVRLEDVVKILEDSDNAVGPEFHEIIATRICKFLNIELENPKPEWEVEYDKHNTLAGSLRGLCKTMFEAGQKSREAK